MASYVYQSRGIFAVYCVLLLKLFLLGEKINEGRILKPNGVYSQVSGIVLRDSRLNGAVGVRRSESLEKYVSKFMAHHSTNQPAFPVLSGWAIIPPYSKCYAKGTY